MALVHDLAEALANRLDGLVTAARAGCVDAPLTVYPAMLAGFAVEALTRPADVDESAAGRIGRMRQVAQSLRGAADLLDDLVNPPAAGGRPRVELPAHHPPDALA